MISLPPRSTVRALRAAISIAASAVLVCLVVGSAAAQGVGLDGLRGDVEAARADLDTVADRFDGEMARYQALTARIETFHAEQSGAFDVYELRAALREAQEAADAVRMLDRQVRAARTALSRAESELSDALRAEVERLEAELRARPSAAGRIVAELNALSDELGNLSSPLPAYVPVPIDEIVRGVSDAPEEIYDAVAELSDAEARIERQIEDIRLRLRDAAASVRVLNAASAFSAEESLLDDDGGRRAGTRGGTPSVTGAAGDGGQGADGQPEVTVGEGTARSDGPTGAVSGDGAMSSGDAAPGGAESDDGASFDAPPPNDADELGGPSEPTRGSDSPIDFGSAGVLGPPTATSVNSADPADGDPTVVDAPSRGTPRGASAAGDLRARQDQLVRELEAIRAERERLAARARALESLD